MRGFSYNFLLKLRNFNTIYYWLFPIFCKIPLSKSNIPFVDFSSEDILQQDAHHFVSSLLRQNFVHHFVSIHSYICFTSFMLVCLPTPILR